MTNLFRTAMQRAAVPFYSRRLARRFMIGVSGGAAAEFAIVLPILSLLLFSIIAFSSFLFIQNNMVNAAREATRQMAIVEAPFSSGFVACDSQEAEIYGSAEYIACQYLTFWGSNFSVNASWDCPVEDPSATVRIRASASGAALADVFSFFDDKTLSVKVTMRKEDPCPI